MPPLIPKSAYSVCLVHAVYSLPWALFINAPVKWVEQVVYASFMQYEIEIELLGNQAASNKLLPKKLKTCSRLQLTSEQRQLNHYFKGGTLESLIKVFNGTLSDAQIAQLQIINKNAKSINVRSRQKNAAVLLIVKSSLDSASAATVINEWSLKLNYHYQSPN